MTVYEIRRLIHQSRFGVGLHLDEFRPKVQRQVRAELERLRAAGSFWGPTVEGLWARSHAWRGYTPDQLRDPAEPFRGILAFHPHRVGGIPLPEDRP